ncbi:MAG TPA: ATP-binding protein [Anaerolineaceae bacterium]|jgi:signal transduction histidine kinase
MNNSFFSSVRRRSDLIVPPLIFILITVYLYAYFFKSVYLGFDFHPSNWEVSTIYVEQIPGPRLRAGDFLMKIGQVTLPEYLADKHLELFQGVKVGQQIPMVVERSGRQFSLNWTVQPPTPGGIRARAVDAWWLAYVFWAFGTATFLLLRPKDTRWRLLVAFNYITGIGISMAVSSLWSPWHSAIMYRIAVWISVPIYIHLHWVFPLRLRKLPGWVAWVGYSAAGGLAIAQWFQWIPSNLVYLGFIFAAAGSVVLLIGHYIYQPYVRRTLSMLLFAAIFAFIPAVLISLVRLVDVHLFPSPLLLIAMPLLPGIYFYTIYRRQLRGIELRANRLISLYIFLIGLAIINLLVISSIGLSYKISGAAYLLAMILPLASAALVVLVFPVFARWIDQRLLGSPLPPTHLVEMYASRISTSPDPQQLVQILRDDVLRSLLVRQSALLCYDDAGKMHSLYHEAIEVDFNPRDQCLQTLWENAGAYHNPSMWQDAHPAISWVRLVIPLVAGNRRVGLWLLGRRDPDDFYAQVEIPTLQALADQTAVALLNHQQAEHLSRLYQVDIDRQEDERLQLALELHDGVLNQLGILALTVDEHDATFEGAYQLAVSNIRQIISGLRPTMLNYGLRSALDELVDEAPAQANVDVAIQIELEDSDVRYYPQVELHLYRIVQEACMNALHHANARSIRIFGSLRPDCFDVTVIDDGAGFSRGQQLSLDNLLANKHFGLAGMIERAHLIGAHMDIASLPGAGTRVRVYGDISK